MGIKRNFSTQVMGKEVAIIGGSSAGLFTAYLLAKEGLNVRVFEADEHFIPCRRTLIVTRYMKDLLGADIDQCIINRINRFELYSDGRFATIPLRHPDLIIERSALIEELKNRAEKAGTKILAGRRFLGVRPNGRKLSFRVSINGNAIDEYADIVIGADGTCSQVAQTMGLKPPETVSLLQAVVPLPGDMPADTTRVWFIPEYTPYFFWLIPHSPAHGVLGLIGDDEGKSRLALENFLKKKRLKPMQFQHALIPRYTKWITNHQKMGSNHLYLVGDAAGHVKMSTVGGIVTGLWGSLGVVESILNGGSSDTLKGLKRELERHKRIRGILNHFDQKDYIMLMDMLNPSVKQSLGALTRDDSVKMLRHCLLKQPRLLLLALRTLLIRR